MDYYKVNTNPTKSPTEEVADLVDFYQSGKHEELVTEAPASRRPSEPVRNTPEPASASTNSSSPKKPAGIFASIKRGFQEGVEKARARSGSDSDEKKTSKVKSALETAEKEVSGALQKADKAITFGVEKVDNFLRKV